MGVVLKKKMPKSSFQGNFFRNGTHFNKLLYHWTANYCDKHVNHCLYTFSSNWPSCFCKVKHMGDSCNGVDRLVQWCWSLRNVRWTGTESQSRLLAFLCKFRHFTLHTLTGRSSKSLIVYKLYVNNLVGDIKANPRDFYRYINDQKKDTQGIPPLERRNDNGVAESELEQADEFTGQFTDVFSKNEHSQVPLPNRLAPFMNDIVVSAVGVTKLLKGLKPSKALGPDELHHRVLKELASELGPVFAHLF